MQCTTTICLEPWIIDSTVLSVVLVALTGLIIWKLVKALVETIPLL